MNKNVLAALLLSVIVFSPLTTVAATTPNEEKLAQLDSLAKSLNSIAELIAASPSLTDADRLALLTQLVAVSTQIMSLQRGSVPTASLQKQVIDPKEEAKKDTAKAAGLTRVIVAFDAKTNVAKAEVKYKSRTEQVDYNFPEVSAKQSFDEKIAELKKVSTIALSKKTNIKVADIDKLLFVTSRNPVRDGSIGPNSSLAVALADKFAQQSIVNKVVVTPGKGSGSIEIFTDQEESLKLTLAEDAKISEVYYGPNYKPTFSYTYQFFISTLSDYYNEFDTTPRPKYFVTSTGATEAQIFNFMAPIFGSIPFSSKIKNFDEKLFKFLVANEAIYYHPQDSYIPVDAIKDEARDCYSAADKLVVTEFVTTLVDGLEAQYENISDIIKFTAPITRSGGFDTSITPACMAGSRVF